MAGKAAAFVAGVATAVAVGAYFFTGPEGRRNRRRAEIWALRAKAELLERIEDAGDMTEAQYHRLVDEVTGNYEKLRRFSRERAAALSEEFKDHWDDMKESARRARQEAIGKEVDDILDDDGME